MCTPYQGQPPQYPPCQGHPAQNGQQSQYRPYQGQPLPQFPPIPGPTSQLASIRLPNHAKVTLYKKVHYEFWDGKKQLFFVNNWGKPDKGDTMPDMSFHAGEDEHAPAVGVIKFKSDEVEIGLGDPRQSNTMSWQHLKSTSKMRTKYSFQAPQGTFTWKKASHLRFADSLQLVEDSSEEVVALFKDNFNKLIQKAVCFDIEKDYGDQWKMTVFISGIALREMVRLEEKRA